MGYFLTGRNISSVLSILHFRLTLLGCLWKNTPFLFSYLEFVPRLAGVFNLEIRFMQCPGKKVLFFSLMFVATLLPLPESFAGVAQQPLTVNVTVLARAKLTVSPLTINFPSANPDTTPLIHADNLISITANSRTTGTGTLDILAHGDLTSGSNTISIGNVTWTATGQGFQGGTMNKTTSQRVGNFSPSGSYAGALDFAFSNSWDYLPGNYSATATLTLTAP